MMRAISRWSRVAIADVSVINENWIRLAARLPVRLPHGISRRVEVRTVTSIEEVVAVSAVVDNVEANTEAVCMEASGSSINRGHNNLASRSLL
jgi:hypothetical protein